MRRNITDWEQTIYDLQSLQQSPSPAEGTIYNLFKICQDRTSDVIGTNIYSSLTNLVGSASSSQSSEAVAVRRAPTTVGRNYLFTTFADVK
jgi:hypothetical protein